MMVPFIRNLFAGVLLLALPLQAAEVRVGVLEFGTVNWEIDTIRHHGLAKRNGVELHVLPLASKEAAAIALQSGSVDIIVTDWLWVSRQRANGADYTFVPHSLAVGGLIVNPAAGIRELSDLAGHAIGIAGGPEDKSWLLLQAFARDQANMKLAERVEEAFAAPPLINELVRQGELAGALNYWHYNARLEATGMHKLVDVEDILPALGIERTPPLLGWAFSDSWAEDHPEAIGGFLDASLQAKKRLLESDAEWKRLRPGMGAGNEMEFVALRNAYRAGIPESYTEKDILAAEAAYSVMANIAGERLTGGAQALAEGTFWDGYRY